ncbi:MAG: hypothetical protein KJ600_00180 [Nanoarchaeota archaeon]|nr:hypothetical protein [Nanoarchaeota archaeon]
MAETVSTGGNVQFRYKKDSTPKLKKEQKVEIDEAYEEYYERRKKEKRKKRIVTIAIIIMVLIILIAAIFLRS